MFGAIAKPQGSLGAHRVPSSSLPSLSMRRRVGGRWPPNAVVPQWPPPPLAGLPFPHPWLWNCGRLFKSALGKPRPAPSEASCGLSLPAARCGRGPGPSSPAPPRRLALVLAPCLTSAFLPLLPFFFSSSSGPRSLFLSLLLPPFNKSVLSNTYYVLLREQEDRRTCPHALPWELSI